MSTRFEYLYRDGSNYKRWGAVVFTGIATPATKSRLMKALESTEFFIAHQVRIPELFFTDSIDVDDHCFHECASVIECDEAADDAHGRTFDEFVAEVERAARDGWKVFDPADRALKRTSGS
jgi:hypothetical protein